MAKNYIQKGCKLSWLNSTGAAIVSGIAIIFGFIGMAIALDAIAISGTGVVSMEGVWAMAKATGAISQGDRLWWSPATEDVTNSPSLNSYFIGYATESALSADATVNVLLEEFGNEGPRVLTLAATGNQTIGAGDFMSGDLTLLVPNTGAKTLALPAVATIPTGAKLTVKKTDATAAAITLDPNASETIAGSATYASQDANNDYAQFINNGTAWILLNAVIA